MTSILKNNKVLLIFTVLLSVLVAGNTNDVFAVEQVDKNPSKIITKGDLYVKSDNPIQVPIEVYAIDAGNDPIQVECDKTQNSIFKIGKTTVRCIAIDLNGNEIRDSFVVTVGYNIVQIPNWFKQTTEFWVMQIISDDEYFRTLDFLLDEQIIHVPNTKTPKDNTESEIPVWIRTNAERWTHGEISDDEFSIGIQWMIYNTLNQK